MTEACLGFGGYYLFNLYQITNADTLYRNDLAGFRLVISKNMNVLEVPIEELSGAVGGDIYFSKNTIDPEKPSGLLIKYRNPVIDVKDDTCLNSQGISSYQEEEITGQLVNVCEIDGFKASYFKHPTKPIEYWVGTVGITKPKEIQIFADSVRISLRIEDNE